MTSTINNNLSFKSTIRPDKDLAKFGTKFAMGIADAAKILAKDGQNDEFVIIKDEYRHFNKFKDSVGGFYHRAAGILLFLQEPKLKIFGKTILSKPLRNIKQNSMLHEEVIKSFNPSNMKALFYTGDIDDFGYTKNIDINFSTDNVTKKIINGVKEIKEAIEKEKQEKKTQCETSKTVEKPYLSEEARNEYLEKMAQAKAELAKQHYLESLKIADEKKAAKILEDIRKG